MEYLKGKQIAQKNGELRAYGLAELEKIMIEKGRMRVDEVIRACAIRNGHEMRIIDSWEKHFRDRHIPYAVCYRTPKQLVIYKEIYTE
jgi:hypothetical protein